MEYLEGTTLDATLGRDRQISVKRSVNIFIQVCAALSAAHAKGIVHRDIKPGNIMLLAGDAVKVLDFGLAKVASEGKDQLSGTGDVCGTVQYMSPEQCKGLELDGRSDIYSLGLTLYEALTGCKACSGTTPYECIIQHLQEPLPPFDRARPDLFIPPSLQAIVDRAVAKNPANRFQTSADFGDALASFSNSNWFGTQSDHKKSFSTLSMIVAACLILACTALGLVTYNLSQAQRAPVVAAPAPAKKHALNDESSAFKSPGRSSLHPEIERKESADMNKEHRETGTVNGVSRTPQKSRLVVNQTPAHHHPIDPSKPKPIVHKDNLATESVLSRRTKTQPSSEDAKSPPVMQAEPPLFDSSDSSKRDLRP